MNAYLSNLTEFVTVEIHVHCNLNPNSHCDSYRLMAGTAPSMVVCYLVNTAVRNKASESLEIGKS